MNHSWSTRLALAVPLILMTWPAELNAQEATRAEEAAETAAARRITLHEALRRMEEGNLELTLARQGVAAAQARLAAAGTLANPNLAVSREQLSGYDETLLVLGQTVEIGGQRGSRRAVSARAVEAAQARLESERQRLTFAVRQAYARVAVAEADLEVITEATEVFRSVDEAGRVRFAEGDISLFERNRLQVERARYESRLAEARLEREDAARELAVLVMPDSLETSPLLLPAEPLSELLPTEWPGSLEEALESVEGRPDVRAAEAEVEAARAAVSLAERRRIPDLTLTGGYKEQADGSRGAVIGVSLPLPLWNRNGGEVAEAQAHLGATLARQRLVVARAQNEIRRAWEANRSLQERARTVGRALLPETSGLLETARIAYAEGEVSLIQLLDAADAYRSAREAVHHLLADHLISIYELYRATGRELPAESLVPSTQ